MSPLIGQIEQAPTIIHDEPSRQEDFYPHMLHTGHMASSVHVCGFTLISGLCYCRHQKAALQPRPPELNAFHTWKRERGEGVLKAEISLCIYSRIDFPHISFHC